MMTTSSFRKRSFAKQNILFRAKGFRSRGAHRTSPFKEPNARYTPPHLAIFTLRGGFPLIIPSVFVNNIL